MNEKYFDQDLIEKAKLLTLDELDISIRLYQFLKSIGVKTLGDVTDKYEDFFSSKNIRGFDSRKKEELDAILKEKGLTYKNPNI